MTVGLDTIQSVQLLVKERRLVTTSDSIFSFGSAGAGGGSALPVAVEARDECDARRRAQSEHVRARAGSLQPTHGYPAQRLRAAATSKAEVEATEFFTASGRAQARLRVRR